MRWVEPDWLHDAELLGRIGRHGLAAIVDLLAPVLAQQGVALPDPSLPDRLYFAELAALFRSQPIKMAVYLAPFFAQGAPAAAPRPAAASGTRLQSAGRPLYALHREGALWPLTFNGCPAILNHEQGLCYVAEMLGQPGERVKKLNLAAKFSSPKAKAGGGGIEVFDPATGRSEPPASAEPVHEAALAVDDNEARKAYQERARELKDTIDDPIETEAAKERAREELEAIIAHLSKDNPQVRDATKGAGDAVGKAIKRLLESLLEAGGSDASPQSVRREFAKQLQRYLVLPSARARRVRHHESVHGPLRCAPGRHEGLCPRQPVRRRLGRPGRDLLGDRAGFGLTFRRGCGPLSNCPPPASRRAGVLAGACPLWPVPQAGPPQRRPFPPYGVFTP
jgi:hypothetical protein